MWTPFGDPFGVSNKDLFAQTISSVLLGADRSLPFYDVNYTMRHHPNWNSNFSTQRFVCETQQNPRFVQLDWLSHKLVAMTPDEFRKNVF